MEFKDLVKNNWNVDIQGNHMFKLVNKLKNLKPHLNKLNWKNGNLFERVKDLKSKLHEVQRMIDLNHAGKKLRDEGSIVL